MIAISKALLKYIIIRTIVFILTIITAYSFAFLLIKMMPTNAVEFIVQQFVSNPTMQQYQDPATIKALRDSLYELFGLKASLWEQYVLFLSRMLRLDFGPSIIAFPTPVSELIRVALPWTLGLLMMATLLSWTIGNVLGVLVTFLESRGGRGARVSKILQGIAIAIYPIPYYIMALVLIFALAYAIRLFPLPGGGTLAPAFSFEWIVGTLHRLALPALSLIIVGVFGWWYLSSRTLTLNIISEDFYQYAEIRGLSGNIILKRYILKNILLPQTTALGLALGGIFGGSLIVEAIFALPGLGGVLARGIGAGDLSTAMGVLSLSILGVSGATYILDIIYPLIDPRVRYR